MVHKDHELLVVDVETTGLDVANDLLLEVAMIAVDDALHVQGTFESLVTEAATMDEITRRLHPKARAMHEENGLLSALGAEYLQPHRATTPLELELKILHFLESAGLHPGRIQLVGYSVHFDKSVLARVFPLFAWVCSYQILDVGGARRMLQLGKHSLKKPDAGPAHRAMADAAAALEELRGLVQIAERAHEAITRVRPAFS